MEKNNALVIHVRDTDELILERTILGSLAGLLPIPLLDDALLRRSRLALLRELGRSAGLHLDDKALQILADQPSSGPLAIAGRSILARVVRETALPLRIADTGRSALITFQLATLLHHYVGKHHRGPDIDEPAAKRLRAAIDRAIADGPELSQVVRSPKGYANFLRQSFDRVWASGESAS